jgi:hypothetical protein
MLIAVIALMGCSGNYGKLKTQSDSDSKVTQQKLIDNWSDYDIRYKSYAIVFDPKNDNRKILLGGNWNTVNNQQTWTAFVKKNVTDQGEFSSDWAAYRLTGVREIWGPDKQLYGFMIHQEMDMVSAMLVEENTMRLWYSRGQRVGGPTP